MFLACALLAAASLAFAFAYVNARASREAEAELRRGLAEASALIDDNRAALTDTFVRLARLVADLPKLKAAVATADPPTVQPIAEEYRQEMRADLLLLTQPGGGVLGAVGPEPRALTALTHRLDGVEQASAYLSHPKGLVQVVSVPVFIDGEPPDLLGRLTAGFFLDDSIAAQLKRLTGSEIAFAMDGRILAATLPASTHGALAELLHQQEIAAASIAGEDFFGIAHPLRTPGVADDALPTALVLRSRTERLRFLDTIRNGLLIALLVTLPLATLLSYGVARGVARPLTALTSAMRDVAATGDLTRKVILKSRRWDDADAQVLAASFNTLTESIARFQREAAQRDRLSSLGRLSTVIAHEIRNPLMAIKVALRALQDPGSRDEERLEAAADIDGEVARLNRIVTDVLDFARPIHFELSDVDVNDVCRDSVAAVWPGAADEAATLRLEDGLPTLPLDAERLRTALVNLLSNARQAAEGAGRRGDAVTLRTHRNGTAVAIDVADRGVGIASEDLPHIFDPYYTTRRAGTGLGLPIAKNIIDGMGGRISVASTRGAGTTIQIEFLAGGAA